MKPNSFENSLNASSDTPLWFLTCCSILWCIHMPRWFSWCCCWATPTIECSVYQLSKMSFASRIAPMSSIRCMSRNFMSLNGTLMELHLSCSLRAEMCWIPSVSKAFNPMSKVSCLVRRVWTFYKFIISDMGFLVKIVVKQIGFVNISQLSKVVHLIFQLFTVLSNRISMIDSLSINCCPAS